MFLSIEREEKQLSASNESRLQALGPSGMAHADTAAQM